MATKSFHDRLASRLAGVFGATSLAIVYAAAGEACQPAQKPWVTLTSTTTGAGAGGADAGTASASTGFGDGTPMPDADPIVQQCLTWPPVPNDAMVVPFPDSGTTDPTTGCPTDMPTVIIGLDPFGCPSGWEAREVVSGPSRDAMNQCCYQVGIHLCLGGGRPFLADDRALTALPVRGAARGWREGQSPAVDRLSAGQRELLADAWSKDALLEHASVASFARFSLMLLGAGAPADLIEAAHRGSLDEIHHARLCFALASAYAGEEVQPGAFPMGAGVSVDASLVAIAVSTVREGCIGETVAAMRAGEQLSRATDPAVRAALERIAEDEARHAELAWKTVRWAVQRGGNAVRHAVRAAFEEALASPFPVTSPGGATGIEDHGLLSRTVVQSVATRTIAELVVPAMQLLLDERLTNLSA